MILDHIDREILRALKENARVSNRKLAQAVGLSESACLERVRRLERSSVILGYHAQLSLPRGGTSLEACASVSLEGLSIEACETFLEAVAKTPSVALAFRVSGAFDVFLYCVCADISEWRSFCQELQDLGVAPGRIRFGVVTQCLNLSRINPTFDRSTA